jgi:hypothetical protein
MWDTDAISISNLAHRVDLGPITTVHAKFISDTMLNGLGLLNLWDFRQKKERK